MSIQSDYQQWLIEFLNESTIKSNAGKLALAKTCAMMSAQRDEIFRTIAIHECPPEVARTFSGLCTGIVRMLKMMGICESDEGSELFGDE